MAGDEYLPEPAEGRDEVILLLHREPRHRGRAGQLRRDGVLLRQRRLLLRRGEVRGADGRGVSKGRAGDRADGRLQHAALSMGWGDRGLSGSQRARGTAGVAGRLSSRRRGSQTVVRAGAVSIYDCVHVSEFASVKV